MNLGWILSNLERTESKIIYHNIFYCNTNIIGIFFSLTLVYLQLKIECLFTRMTQKNNDAEKRLFFNGNLLDVVIFFKIVIQKQGVSKNYAYWPWVKTWMSKINKLEHNLCCWIEVLIFPGRKPFLKLFFLEPWNWKQRSFIKKQIIYKIICIVFLVL